MTKKVKPYYTLFVRSPETGEWEDVFGSYRRSECKAEWDYDYCYYGEYTPKDHQIIATDGSHEMLLAVHRHLNPDEVTA